MPCDATPPSARKELVPIQSAAHPFIRPARWRSCGGARCGEPGGFAAANPYMRRDRGRSAGLPCPASQSRGIGGGQKAATASRARIAPGLEMKMMPPGPLHHGPADIGLSLGRARVPVKKRDQRTRCPIRVILNRCAIPDRGRPGEPSVSSVEAARCATALVSGLQQGER